ncbi:uncharacterized protein LOC132197164 isoform X2 [Neocloeon triangulifer]|uniref:uncharacterized protein LOC132197164 isoform X2 n=1 Tax=Neocloeon triangulifer TaxID=2078957 RepID=UPI00286EF3D3|nr:uncharacterized protein LOC132197164 isoform X2 [Neocloeon triangulifer]
MRRSGLTALAALVLVVSCATAASLGPNDHNRPKKFFRGHNKKGLRHKVNVDDYLAAPSNNFESPVSFLTPPAGNSRPVDRRQRSPFAQQKQQSPSGSPNPTRQSRFLSLFSVVRFENLECGAVSGDNGTCLAARECLDRGGVASGPCAGGFGVCCVFIVTCGQTTFQNSTYFVNSGYPGPYDGTGSCQLTIHKRHPDICQLRLDFDQFMIGGPEIVNHVCSNDQFIVSGGSPVPAICGTNTGNHMYVDAGAGYTSPVTLTFVTSGPAFPRNWKVRISQIPCMSNYKAEDGCLQYYTGVTGQIRSFNYDSGMGLQLSNQDYSICIRMERNFCGIQYITAPDPVNNRSRSFSLSGQTTGQNQVTSMVGSVGPNSCNGDWIIIPCAANAGRAPSIEPTCTDRICGGTFNSEVSTVPATVFSTVKPFRIIYHTNNIEFPNDQSNRGFALNYVQQPCSNILN